MNYVDLMLRLIHILSAIILAGGIFFWRAALLPVLDGLPQSTRHDLQSSLAARWSRWVMLTSGLLLISGLVNAVLAITRYEFQGGWYHILVAVKLLLALGVFAIASVLSGRSATAQRFRAQQAFWLDVSLVLILVMVSIAGMMKMTDRVEKASQTSAAAVRDEGGGLRDERSGMNPSSLNTHLSSHETYRISRSMDKKAKKKLDVLHQRLQQLRQQLAGAKQQTDEPGEIERIERQIAAVEADVARLKAP